MEWMNSGIERELPKGLIAWFDFKRGSKGLFVRGGSKECDVIGRYMRECGISVDEREAEELVYRKTQSIKFKYDYIVLAGVIERCSDAVTLLEVLRGMISETGKMIIGADNRLGARYFCGDRDIFTERNFDGIENYVRRGNIEKEELDGRAYSKAELQDMLEQSGFCCHRFYTTVPSFTHPQIIIAENYLPQEELETRIYPEYNFPDSVFLEEQNLYSGLIHNGLFHAMADGFLIECCVGGDLSDAMQITNSLERGRENAYSTIVRKSSVEKRAVYAAGEMGLRTIVRNAEDLRNHGISVLDAALQAGRLVMPYVRAENATAYFRRLIVTDKNLFFKELDRFWQMILHSSEHVPYQEIDWERFEPDWQKRKMDDPDKDKWKKIAFGTEEEKKDLGVILRCGYIDMASINCFFIDGEFVFFDQEFRVNNLPAAALMLRTIKFIYQQGAELEKEIPMKCVLERYHIWKHRELFVKFEQVFFRSILKQQDLMLYYKAKRTDSSVINSNRQRMNYSEYEYQRLFRDIFAGTEGRDIYLFGSGNFAKLFISRFGEDYRIAGIFDNNSLRWGKELDGIPILSPEEIEKLETGTYKIIICIKNCMAVIKQLINLGVRDYGVFDTNIDYPRKHFSAVQPKEGTMPKKYHLGYVAGVFDVFHIGHLNLLRRAKEQCEYLIVGVVSDESVMKGKRTAPYIPFDERLEIVRACRYVDEAVKIPEGYENTEEAYMRYRFDVQFSGSDYEKDPIWLSKKDFLERHGADMVFFPYTEHTSSTKIKERIRGDRTV